MAPKMRMVGNTATRSRSVGLGREGGFRGVASSESRDWGVEEGWTQLVREARQRFDDGVSIPGDAFRGECGRREVCVASRVSR